MKGTQRQQAARIESPHSSSIDHAAHGARNVLRVDHEGREQFLRLPAAWDRSDCEVLHADTLLVCESSRYRVTYPALRIMVLHHHQSLQGE
jgi:hypothetical protein